MAVFSQSLIESDLKTYSVEFTPGANGNIPLTTIFTPPSSCLATVTYNNAGLWQGGLLQKGDQNCYPESFRNIYASLYTPGICPRGWMSVANPNGVGPFTQSDGILASKAYCCPSGYYHTTAINNYILNVCASGFQTPLTNVYSTTTLGEGPIPTDPSLITVDPQDVEANTVYADIIQIQWAMTDSDILRLMSESTSSSSSQAQPTAAQTAHRTTSNVDPTVSPTSTMTSTQASDNGGISAGAIAGIGIGAAVAAVVLVLLAYFLGRWRRPKRQNNAMEDGNNAKKSRAEELPPTSFVELPSKNAQELPTREIRSELGSMR